ncbi:hypothetical protein [Stappia stellulata]|uniref:hypothetical protein n=1 Tax=Stappia stellulata TaxID=71235 RepID=UPI00048E5499|nr:hypothetical protein [Stappia stellulata]
MPTPTTANRGYPLPHPENELDTDVQRLVSALQSIDGDVASLLISVSQAALASHGHVIGDVTGLQAALNDKAAAGHTHAINDLTDVDITGAPAGRPLTTQAGGGVGIGPAPMTQAQVDAAIAAAIAALADAAPATLDTLNELAAALGDDPNFAATMTAALGGKASTSHTHTTAEVSGLDAALAGTNADVASNTGRIDALESAPDGATVLAAQDTAGTTGVDITGIPAEAKLIRITFDAIEIGSSTAFYLLLGDSGGFETSGYRCVAQGIDGSNELTLGSTSSSFYLYLTHWPFANADHAGFLTLTKHEGNTWTVDGKVSNAGPSPTFSNAYGKKTLSGVLDRVRVYLGANPSVEGRIQVTCFT